MERQAGKMKRFQEILMKDFGWKLLSVAIATIMWFMVISINQPVDTRTYSTMLTLTGTETLTARGLTVANAQDLENTKISIKVKAQRTALDRLSQRQAELISANVDLSGLTYAQSGDKITLPVNVVVANGTTGYTIESKVPVSVEIQVETLVSKEFSVSVALNGSVPHNATLSEPQLSTPTIMVKGPKSVIDGIMAVRVTVDAMQAAGQDAISVKPVAYDRDGVTVNGVTFSEESITVSYRLQEQKQIQIQVQTTGQVAAGYHLTELNCNPQTITIMGTAETLQSVGQIVLKPLDITNATVSVSKTYALENYLPKGVVLPKGMKTVQVMAHIIKSTDKTVTVPTTQIALQNQQSHLAYTMPDTVSVTLLGDTTALETVSAENLTAIIDVSGLEAGEHTANISWQLPEGVTAEPTTVVLQIVENTPAEPEPELPIPEE